MRVVLDTNVFISATLWDGSVAQKLLFKLLNSNIDVYTSMEILSEYKKVLKRDFDYSDNDIIYIFQKILSFSRLIKPTEKIELVKEDPEDNKILECALASFADYIVTYDKHLLKIGVFKNIKIVKPEEIISTI